MAIKITAGMKLFIEQPRFKVDQLVKIMNPHSIYFGVIGKIWGKQPNGEWMIEIDKGDCIQSCMKGIYCEEKFLEGVPPPQTPEFKVGDKVKVISVQCCGLTNTYLGKTGSIEDISQNGCIHVRIDNLGYIVYFYAFNLEAIASPKFKAGDRVKVIGKNYDPLYGKTFFITNDPYCSKNRKYDDGTPVIWMSAKPDGSTGRYSMHQDDLELIKSSEEESKGKLPILKFKTGDNVQIVIPNTLSHGKIGKIIRILDNNPRPYEVKVVHGDGYWTLFLADCQMIAAPQQEKPKPKFNINDSVKVKGLKSPYFFYNGQNA